jgi:hypothetical protein
MLSDKDEPLRQRLKRTRSKLERVIFPALVRWAIKLGPLVYRVWLLVERLAEKLDE